MALKEVLLCAVPERRGHATPRRATWGGTRAGQEADRVTEPAGRVHEKEGEAGQVVQVSSGWDSVSNFSGLRATGWVSSCP